MVTLSLPASDGGSGTFNPLSMSSFANCLTMPVLAASIWRSRQVSSVRAHNA